MEGGRGVDVVTMRRDTPSQESIMLSPLAMALYPTSESNKIDAQYSLETYALWE